MESCLAPTLPLKHRTRVQHFAKMRRRDVSKLYNRVCDICVLENSSVRLGSLPCAAQDIIRIVRAKKAAFLAKPARRATKIWTEILRKCVYTMWQGSIPPGLELLAVVNALTALQAKLATKPGQTRAPSAPTAHPTRTAQTQDKPDAKPARQENTQAAWPGRRSAACALQESKCQMRRQGTPAAAFAIPVRRAQYPQRPDRLALRALQDRTRTLRVRNALCDAGKWSSTMRASAGVCKDCPGAYSPPWASKQWLSVSNVHLVVLRPCLLNRPQCVLRAEEDNFKLMREV